MDETLVSLNERLRAGHAVPHADVERVVRAEQAAPLGLPLARRIFTEKWGPLDVLLEHHRAGWVAKLAQEHPRMRAVIGALGSTEAEALERIAWAVHTSASDWPVPPRSSARDLEAEPYVPAPEVVQVLVEQDGGRERLGWACGWRGQEVWVCWQQGGLDSTAWVPAEVVRRVED